MTAVAAAIATALGHSLWQGVLAGLAVLVGDLAVARDRADVRHRLRVLALGGWVIAFVVTLCSPAVADPRSVAEAAVGPSLPPVLALAWATGVAVLSLRTSGAMLRLSLLRRRARPVTARVQALADRVARRLGTAAVEVREHVGVPVPCVLGVLRPVVLLPAGVATGLPPWVLRAVLVHELGHVLRRDPWINALCVVATTLLFHHPVAWWLARGIRREREHACDELAAPHCGGGLRYAKALVELAAWRSPLEGRTVPLGVPALGGELRRRVARIAGIESPSAHRRRVGPWALGVLVAALALAPASRPLAAGAGLRRPALSIPPATGSGFTLRAKARTPSASVGIMWLPASVRAHEDAIAHAAARHGLDPDLLAIVVLVESRGDPNARSPAGARGLMQVMPATARAITRGRGEPAPTLAELHDPARSLDLGATYLARQLHAFADEPLPRRIELAAAAYNAGPAPAHAYRDRGEPLPPETERYRRRVAALWTTRHAPAPAP